MLKYPLNYFDEGGRMKPPLLLYVLLLFVCRGLLILIVSLSFREDSELLIRMFYPQSEHFNLSLIPMIPALFALYLISSRNSLWENKRYHLFKPLSKVVSVALLVDLSIQTYILSQTHFQYSLALGINLMLLILFISYHWKSTYLKDAYIDWKTP